jgi:hypothetical protein
MGSEGDLCRRLPRGTSVALSELKTLSEDEALAKLAD